MYQAWRLRSKPKSNLQPFVSETMNNRVLIKKFSYLIFIICLYLFSIETHAAINNSGLLDSVASSYTTAASGWLTSIKARATWLFWTLATISLTYTAGMMVLRKADIGEFFGEFIKFILLTGFYDWLLIHSPNMAKDIMNSMMTLGATASGTGGAISPSGIVDVGFALFSAMIANSTIWQPVDSAVGFVITLIILVVLALIGVNMLLLMISGWVLAYAGVFYLGFGGARWTSDMAISYYKTVLSIGIQLLTMILLVGIGQTIITNYYNNMTPGSSGNALNLNEMGVMLVAAIVLLQLTNKIPPMLGQIAMGGGAHALGNGFGTGAAMAAAGVAGSMLAAGGAALLAGAANTAGGAQAISAAFQKASADVSGAGSSISGGTPDYNSSGGSGSSGSSQQTATSPESTPLGKAMGLSSSPSITQGSSGSSGIGNAAKIAAGTASNLASGVGQVAKEKFQNFKDNVQNRIDQTLPGQVATVIKNDMPSFGENSLAGDNSHDPAAEVAAFVNRSEQA